MNRLMPKFLRNRPVLREIVFLVAFFAIIEFAAPRFLVAGPSMQPTFWDDQRLIASRIPYLISQPERGDIVVFHSPKSGEALIKRIIGQPGDVVEFREGELYINGKRREEPYINEPCQSCPDRSWSIGADEYFVMGDNRNHSNDSRAFGPVPRSLIIAEALVRFWPPQSLGLLKQIGYKE